MEQSYEQAWRDLSRRERSSWIAVALWLSGGLARALHAPAWWIFQVAFTVAFMSSLAWSLNFRCPRCGGRFLGHLSWRGMLCKNCGLARPAEPEPFRRWRFAMVGAVLGGGAAYTLGRVATIASVMARIAPTPWSLWMPGALVGALLGLALALRCRSDATSHKEQPSE